MRQFEIVLLVVVLFAVLWPAVFGVRPRRGLIGGALLAAAAAQMLLEGWRWQLLPLYLVAFGLAVGDVLFLSRDLEWSNRLARGLFGTLGVALVVSPALLLPVPEMPRPSGPAPIGTQTFELVDTDREEIYGENPGGSRRFMVQAFYPAVLAQNDEPMLWAEDWDVLAPAMARSQGLPSWILNHTKYTDSYSHPDARVVAGSFPVIIYSHGWTGSRSIAPNQLETLASNGYLVLSIDHTHAAVVTVLSDGEVVEYDPIALPEEEDVGAEEYQLASEILVETFANDIAAVLDALDLGEEGPFGELANVADASLVGVYGHSTGGGASVRACLLDERCDAVLGMDAWVEPLPDDILKITPTKPALYMRSDGWRGTPNDNLLRGIADRSEATTYWLGIEGASHNDFTAAPLMSPVSGAFGFRGSIPRGRIIPIIDNYLLGFFDVFLLGTGTAALDSVAFEEVAVELLEP